MDFYPSFQTHINKRGHTPVERVVSTVAVLEVFAPDRRNVSSSPDGRSLIKQKNIPNRINDLPSNVQW